MMRLLFIILILCVFSNISSAQNLDKRTELLQFIKGTAGTGLASYYGDMCDRFECFRYRPQVNIGAYYRFNRHFSFKSELYYIRLFGTDKGGTNKNRNLSFRSYNIEFYVGAVFDLFKYERFYHKRKPFTPYIFAGTGILFFNPKAKYEKSVGGDGKWHSLQPLQTEGKKYSRITYASPFGGGIRLKQSSNLDICFEITYTKLFTDYLDDVSTNFVDNTSFNDPIAAALADRSQEGGFNISTNPNDPNHWEAGHKRGNPNRNDGYMVFGFKVEYLLMNMKQRTGKTQKVPKFKEAKYRIPTQKPKKKKKFSFHNSYK